MSYEIQFELFFFFKQKTAYEISSRDWSSDVCSSDLALELHLTRLRRKHDRRSVGDHGAGGLQEQQRLRRHGVAELRGMVSIVASDADDLAGSRDAHGRISSASTPRAVSSSSSVL